MEIHGANGYLLDQFLTDYTNTRPDQCGGSSENRVRLTLKVVATVRAAIGTAVPLGVRISQAKVNDHVHKWAGAEKDAEIIFGSLADAGVDYIHVAEFEAWQPAFKEGPSLAHFAKKYAPDTAILENGSLHDVAKAEEVLRQGADVVTLGRGALANPDFPARVAQSALLRDFDPTVLFSHRQRQG